MPLKTRKSRERRAMSQRKIIHVGMGVRLDVPARARPSRQLELFEDLAPSDGDNDDNSDA